MYVSRVNNRGWRVVIVLCDLIVGLVAIAWVLWLGLCAACGPRGRRFGIACCICTLALAALLVIGGIFERYSVTAGYGYPLMGNGRFFGHVAEPLLLIQARPLGNIPLLFRAALEMTFPLITLTLLTRPPMRRLFDQSPAPAA